MTDQLFVVAASVGRVSRAVCRRGLMAIAIVLAGESAMAQTTASTGEVKAWSFSASAYAYFVPDDRNYVQPTVIADRGPLRLVARYNYEDFNTGSLWMGWNFSMGEELVLEFAPLAGVVFGNTKGIAPGYMASLGWRELELYSESEYVFDTDSSSDSFFYNWSELTLAPAEWFRFGVVMQRTQAYESEREIQRGVLAGGSYRSVDLSAYVFNPDDDRPTVVLALGLEL